MNTEIICNVQAISGASTAGLVFGFDALVEDFGAILVPLAVRINMEGCQTTILMLSGHIWTYLDSGYLRFTLLEMKDVPKTCSCLKLGHQALQLQVIGIHDLERVL